MKRFLIFLVVPFILSACDLMQNNTASQSPLNTQTFTSSPSPSQKPTGTLYITATPLPPPVTATPFLPEELPLIEPENIANLQIIAEIPVKEIYNLTVSPAGIYVVTLSQHWEDRSRYMEVWNLNTGAQVYQQEKIDIPSDTFFLPGETTLVVLFPYDDHQVRNYDLPSGKIVSTLDIPFHIGALSPDGKFFAAGDRGDISTVTLYDFTTGEEISAINSVGRVSLLGFSPDGNLLVTGFSSFDHFYLRLWDVASLELITEMVDYSSPKFILDNSLAASSREGTVLLFDPKGWVPEGSIDTKDIYSNGRPRSFSKDGRILIFSDSYKTVFLDVTTGEEIFALPDYGDGLFSPNGNIVLTWCYQCNLTIWGVNP